MWYFKKTSIKLFYNLTWLYNSFLFMARFGSVAKSVQRANSHWTSLCIHGQYGGGNFYDTNLASQETVSSSSGNVSASQIFATQNNLSSNGQPWTVSNELHWNNFECWTCNLSNDHGGASTVYMGIQPFCNFCHGCTMFCNIHCCTDCRLHPKSGGSKVCK